MASVFDRLRAGDVVEIEPGKKGRLNLKDKTLETSDGRRIYVGDDEDFFPSNEQALLLSREKESIERDVSKIPGGEFLYQFGQQGLVGSGQNWINKFRLNQEDYARKRQAQQTVSERISERSPYISGAATVASFIPDLVATRGLSALKAAPLLTAAHAGPRILEEPGQVAGEAALSAAGGFLLDKGASALNRISQRRALSRSIPAQQEAINAQNIAGKQAVESMNAQNKQQYSDLLQKVRGENATKLEQYQNELNLRQNKMITDKNFFDQAQATREAEVLRLKTEADLAKAKRSADAAQKEAEYLAKKEATELENKRLASEFKQSQKDYESALKELPNVQRRAQEEFSQGVLRNVQRIEKAFPAHAKIQSSDLGVRDFIENKVNKVGLGGSREATQAVRTLNALFPEGEALTAADLANRYKGIENAILKSPSEAQNILNAFKEHLGERLPNLLADNLAYAKTVPFLKKELQKNAENIVKNLKLPVQGVGSQTYILNKLKANIDKFFQDLNSSNFLDKLRDGSLKNEIQNNLLTFQDFSPRLVGEMALKKAKKGATVSTLDQLSMMGLKYATPEIGAFESFSQQLPAKIDQVISSVERRLIGTEADAAHRLGRSIEQTVGLAPSVAEPMMPIAPQQLPLPAAPAELPPVSAPQFPPPIAKPQVPALPPKPSLTQEPTAPMAQSFTPQPLPSLPAAQTGSEKIGDFLEQNLLGGKGLVNNPITKLAGLKFLAGKAALPLEASYLGLKGLTSPSAAGEMARMSFKQFGIEAIDQMAQKYLSYHEGILEDPMERRSLTKEIENDREIPIEQKALLQSKINRGIPLFDRLM